MKNGFILDEVEKFLGYTLKKTGRGEYRGACPYCRQEGHDNTGDNLNFSETQGFFCGACTNNEHGKRIAREIAASRNQNKVIYKKVSELTYSKNDLEKYNLQLFQNKEMLELVKNETGLSENVIKECKIGYCEQNKVFVLPMIALDNSITGLEIRIPENNKGKFKFLCKTKGYAENIEKCLSKINSLSEAKKAIICAGYKDGYAIYQYLKDQGQENEYQILTNTNGEPNTARAFEPHIDYLKEFEQIILCLDNDKAGKQAVKKIEQSIPIIFYNLNLGRLNGISEYINDFNDLYKYIKSNNISSNLIEQNLKLSIHSILKLYIKDTNSDFEQKKIVNIGKKHGSFMEYFKNGIYSFQNNYYQISYNSESSELTYIRKSNFTINILRQVIFNTLNFENQTEYRLEVVTNIGQKTTKPKILTQKELLDIGNLHEILKEGGVHLHTLKDKELKNIILEELKNIGEELYVYKNPSLIHHQEKPYWIYKNAVIDLEKDTLLVSGAKNKEKTANTIQTDLKSLITLKTDKGMHSPKLYVPNISYDEFIKTNKNEELINEFKSKSDTIESLITKALFINTLRTYGNKTEPFLALGTAIMSPFVDILFEKTMGYPINFLYGEAASGKSNLLQTIAYLFGFDVRFLSSGNDTSMSLLHNMEYYKNIPILYAEIEGYMRKNFETTVKAVYDRNPRKRMKGFGQKQDIRAINAALNLASNDRAHRNPQTATRLVYTEFLKDNFNPDEARKINNIREKYLSCILPEILKRYSKKDAIFNDLENKKKIIQNFNPNLDLRCVNNIAIAMLGMDYLFQAAKFDKEFQNSEEIKLIQQNLEIYIKTHQEIISTEDCFDKFMQIFYQLAKCRVIKHGIDYILKPADRTICIHLKAVYTPFKKQFKQTEDSGVPIPDIKDIQKEASSRGFKVGYSVDFDGHTKRALVVETKTNEFLNSIFIELQRLEEKGHSEDLI